MTLKLNIKLIPQGLCITSLLIVVTVQRGGCSLMRYPIASHLGHFHLGSVRQSAWLQTELDVSIQVARVIEYEANVVQALEKSLQN